MLADRADLRSLGSYYDMSAVTALPDGNAALLKHLHGLHVAQKLAVALLVHLLNGSYATELFSQIMESFLVSLTGHAVIHIRPLGVLAFGSMEKVLGSIAQLAQSFEPQFSVLLLVLCSMQEQSGNLLVTGFFGYGSKVSILVAGLRFPSKSFPQILLGLGTCIGIFCRSCSILNLHELVGRLLADGALKIRCHRAFVNVTADCAFPFFHFCFLRFFIELNGM